MTFLVSVWSLLGPCMLKVFCITTPRWS